MKSNRYFRRRCAGAATARSLSIEVYKPHLCSGRRPSLARGCHAAAADGSQAVYAAARIIACTGAGAGRGRRCGSTTWLGQLLVPTLRLTPAAPIRPVQPVLGGGGGGCWSAPARFPAWSHARTGTPRPLHRRPPTQHHHCHCQPPLPGCRQVGAIVPLHELGYVVLGYSGC
jgi:hypothetical protein